MDLFYDDLDEEVVLSSSGVSIRSLKTDTLRDVFQVYFICYGTRILLLQWLVSLGVRFTLEAPIWTDVWLALAVIVWWPFQEWFAHLYILHARPRKIGFFTFDSKAARVHRFHHQHPWDLHAVFVPPEVIGFLVPVHFAFWYLMTPTWSLCWTGMLIYTSASLIYEWVHLFSHVSYRPKSKYFQKVQQHHRAHHFKNENYWHAFTIPLIDTIFGTGPDPKMTPRSGTTKTLGIGVAEENPN